MLNQIPPNNSKNKVNKKRFPKIKSCTSNSFHHDKGDKADEMKNDEISIFLATPIHIQ